MRKVLTLLLVFVVGDVLCQEFRFLEIPANAQTAALGGYAVSGPNNDATLIVNNPALLDSIETGNFAFMFNPYFADISRYSVTVIPSLPVVGKLGVATVFMDYGEFERTDLIGNETGQFRVVEYLIQLTKSHRAGPFSMGTNLKIAGSNLDMTGATALLFDVGGVYDHPSREFNLGLVIRNIGWYLADYGDVSDTSIPFDVQIGTTFKPEYMPVRFTFTVFDLADRSEKYETTGEEIRELDKVLRNINVGGAFLIGDYVEILAGYNQKRRQELRLSDGAHGAGFSWGLLVKIRELQLRFSRSAFHAAGGTSYFSLQSNVESIKRIF